MATPSSTTSPDKTFDKNSPEGQGIFDDNHNQLVLKDGVSVEKNEEGKFLIGPEDIAEESYAGGKVIVVGGQKWQWNASKNQAEEIDSQKLPEPEPNDQVPKLLEEIEKGKLIGAPTELNPDGTLKFVYEDEGEVFNPAGPQTHVYRAEANKPITTDFFSNKADIWYVPGTGNSVIKWKEGDGYHFMFAAHNPKAFKEAQEALMSWEYMNDSSKWGMNADQQAWFGNTKQYRGEDGINADEYSLFRNDSHKPKTSDPNDPLKHPTVMQTEEMRRAGFYALKDVDGNIRIIHHDLPDGERFNMGFSYQPMPPEAGDPNSKPPKARDPNYDRKIKEYESDSKLITIKQSE